MDPSASDSSAPVASLVSSNGGPVCHEIQPLPGDLRVPSDRSSGLGSPPHLRRVLPLPNFTV